MRLSILMGRTQVVTANKAVLRGNSGRQLEALVGTELVW